MRDPAAGADRGVLRGVRCVRGGAPFTPVGGGPMRAPCLADRRLPASVFEAPLEAREQLRQAPRVAARVEGVGVSEAFLEDLHDERRIRVAQPRHEPAPPAVGPLSNARKN